MKVSDMTRDELRKLLDADGGDARLEAMLAEFAGPTAQDELSAMRVLAKLNGPLPRQKQPFWRVPAALLDWQFAPAWPRLAALAGCAVIGFSIGIAGVDRTLAPPDTQIATRDIGTMVFGPELFTGTRP
jgi:hypothetical protein